MKFLRYLIFGVILFSGALLPHAEAATLNAIPSGTIVKKGDLVTVRLAVSPEGIAINNSEGVLHFPTNILSVVSVSKGGSIFSLWVEEPAFSNAGGTVTYNGGIPNPGFSGSSGTVLTVTFLAKQPGTATISLTDAAVRANDGNGTDVLSGTRGAQITVTDTSAPAPVPQVQTPTPPIKQTEAPVSPTSINITSATHPDQSAWYSNINPVLTWSISKSAEQVQLIVDPDENAQPVVTYKPAISQKKITDLSDGTWYFRIRVKEKATWGNVYTYRLNIDTTPPTVENHAFTYDANTHSLLITASSTDAGSGVAGYEVRVDNGESVALDRTAFLAGAYSLPIEKTGKHEVSLLVKDHAGNTQVVTGSIIVPTNTLDTVVFSIGSFGVTLFWLLILMFVISLLALVVAIIVGIYLGRHRHREHPLLTVVEKDIHRSFDVYRLDLKKNLRLLEQTREKRALTAEETKLHKSMLGNLTQLERYISERVEDAE